MEPKLIRTKGDYEKSLREVAPLFDTEPTPGSAAGNRLEVQIMLIEANEAKHYAMTPPTPIEAIEFRMEQAGLTVNDLEPMIGRSNRVYEVLNGKRTLTLPMIRHWHSMLGIKAESLIA
jgi:HTH-type transcriptional regulator / antitoxin HigA